MNKFYLSVFLFFLLISEVKGQTYWIPKTPLLDTILKIKAPISEITNSAESHFLPVFIHKSSPPQHLIKSKNSLFIIIEGTGQVYKETQENKISIAFTRVDSTYYGGYNFGATLFISNEQLYSFGGYGFWHTNGSLRIFRDNEREWEIVKINHEYPTCSPHHCYLPNIGKLYYYSFSSNEITNETTDIPSIIEFDLKSRMNYKLGDIQDLTLFQNNTLQINTPSLEGVLIAIQGDLFLFQFQKNRYFKLINDVAKHTLLGTSNSGMANNCFEFNQRIYFTKRNESKVHFISLSLNDFAPIRKPIFLPKSPIYPIWAATIILFTLILIIFFLFRPIKRTSIFSSKSTISSGNSNEEDIPFNEQEKELIMAIIEATIHRKGANVEAINQKLGLSKKTLEIQKKLRSEFINRINHKFRVNFNQNVDLIERIRSIEDRRYFIYTISKANELIFKGL